MDALSQDGRGARPPPQEEGVEGGGGRAAILELEDAGGEARAAEGEEHDEDDDGGQEGGDGDEAGRVDENAELLSAKGEDGDDGAEGEGDEEGERREEGEEEPGVRPRKGEVERRRLVADGLGGRDTEGRHGAGGLEVGDLVEERKGRQEAVGGEVEEGDEKLR